MDPVRLALDVGPLHGHRTGIGAAVDALATTLGACDDVALRPYLLSFRSRPAPPTRRLPLPAAVAHELWSRARRAPRRPLARRRRGRPRHQLRRPADPPPGRGLGLRLLVPDPPGAGGAAPCAAPARCCGGGCGPGRRSTRRATPPRRWCATCSGPSASRSIHLGPLAVPDAAPARPPTAWAAALADRPFVLALGTLERRKDRAGAGDGVRRRRRRPRRRPARHRRRGR